MSNWYSGIYKAFIISGVIAFIIGMFTQGDLSLGAYISGYSVLTLGIMMILLILFNNVMRITENQSILQILYSIIMATGPFILMLGIIGFLLYLMIFYKDKIINEQVSQNYHSFSNITVILILIQLYIIYTNISTDRFISSGKLSKITSSIIYLMNVLTIISSIILFTILKYYTTDGFK